MEPTTSPYLLVELVEKGGWVMYPLLFCSLAALAIIVERLIWGPRESRVIPPALRAEIYSLLDRGRFEELKGLCRASDTPAARIVATALKNADLPRQEVVEALQLNGRREAELLLKYVSVLGTIAVITPLLGLLGTVSGMIETFSVMEAQGVGNAAALAGGISEALFTTATGLCIAIPSLIFFRSLNHRARQLILKVEELSLEVLQAISIENEVEASAEIRIERGKQAV